MGISTRSSLDDPRIHVYDSGLDFKCRKVHFLTHTAPFANWRVHNNDIHTTARAILERVLLCNDDGQWKRPPVPHFGVIDTMLYGFKTALRKYSSAVEPMTRDVFVHSYVGRRRKRMANAAESLDMVDLNFRDVRISAFVKAEKLAIHNKPDPTPRIIQPRTSRFHVEYGRFIKPIEKVIYAAIDKVFGGRTVMKGLNAQEVGNVIYEKWSRFREPVAVSLDASRYDQHVSKALLLWIKSAISPFIPLYHRREFHRLFDWKLRTHGFARCPNGFVKYVVDYGLCSGDMDTSLIGILGDTSMLYTYLHQLDIDAEVVNMGDDAVVILERRDLARFMALIEPWFRMMGFKIKAEEPVYRIEHIQFCQCRPVYTPSGYIMVRNFPNAWSKDTTTLLGVNSEKLFYRWLTSIGLCNLRWMGGIPVYDTLYRSMLFDVQALDHPSFEDNSERYWARGMDRSREIIHPDTRVSFYYAFGVTPDEQTSYESTIPIPRYTSSALRDDNCGFILTHDG